MIMKKFRTIALLSALCAGALLISCNDDDDPDPEPSLYTRLGGTTLVADPNNPGQMIEQGRLSYRSVVDSTIVLIVADISTGVPGNFGAHFAPLVAEVTTGNTTNLAELSDNLTDFFSANTGGGESNTYTGLDMVSAHNPAVNSRMGVKANNANYDKFIGYVGSAAALNGVTDEGIVNDVVDVLESLRDPIVQDPN
jgi:hypothetical protein